MGHVLQRLLTLGVGALYTIDAFCARLPRYDGKCTGLQTRWNNALMICEIDGGTELLCLTEHLSAVLGHTSLD